MRVLTLFCAVAALVPCVMEAQVLAGLGGPIREADLLYFSERPLEAYQLLGRHLEAHPDDYEALWRATRSGVVLGVSEEGTRFQNRWLDPAMAFGDRAIIQRPGGIEGLYWRGAAYGRRAMNASPGYAKELVQTVYDDAHAILAQDPLHGGAHNLLGKLNYEVMTLSRLERGFARLVMGNRALREASWEGAESHLEAATQLWPDQVLFRYDLAQLYRRRGREDEARRTLQALVRLPTLHPSDGTLQDDARRFLEELRN